MKIRSLEKEGQEDLRVQLCRFGGEIQRIFLELEMFLEVINSTPAFPYNIVAIFELVWTEPWELDLEGASLGKDPWGYCPVLGKTQGLRVTSENDLWLQ